jgi:uncharacterized iron-regulated protein
VRARLPWLVLAVSLCTGCASLGAASKGGEASPAHDLEQGSTRVLDLRSSSDLALDEAVSLLASHRHVYVGEHHGEATSHRVQLEVLEALRSHGVSVFIGIEWLPAMVQMRLDAWLRGDLPEDALLETIAWRDHWGHRDEHYVPVFEWARRHGVSIVCLGPPTGLARRLFRVGVDGLTLSERSQLPPMTSGNEAHRRFFEALMKRVAHGHFHEGPGNEKVMERFYQAQLVRDEFMAARIVEAFKVRTDGVLVVLAGRGHVDHGLGIPLRVEAATTLPFLSVVPATTADDAQLPSHRSLVKGRLVGDLLWIPRFPAP